MKVQLVALTFVLIFGFRLVSFECEALKKCPGKCTSNLTLCKANGGRIAGYCSVELACCDLSAKSIGSCGESKSGIQSATFQSPEFPDFVSGNLVCKFEFHLSPNAQGLSVEFIEGKMEGCGFAPHSECEADQIFLKGFPNWQPPPRCGNLTGYVAVIDQKAIRDMKTLTILAVMSSKKYKWQIKITQLSHHKHTPQQEHLEELTVDSDTLIESEKLLVSNLMAPRNRKMPESHPLIAGGSLTNPIESSSSNEDGILDFEEPLVVNGKDTLISDVPWQVSLRKLYPKDFLKSRNLTEDLNKEGVNCTADGLHFCGGSIISNQHILSAAHCFHGSSKLRDWQLIGEVNIVLGDTDLCSDDEVKYGKPSKFYTIEKVMYHYAYDDSIVYNDMLVIKLKEKIQFNDYIKPIALSKRNMSYVGKSVKVSGWGLTNLTIPHPGLPMILQSTDEMFVQKPAICDGVSITMFAAPKKLVDSYPKYNGVFQSTLCTSYPSNDTFKLVGPGDSGGPLIIMENDHPVQIGVVSYGVQALPAVNLHDNKFVDFFQDVSYYRDWIDLAMLA